MRQDLCNKRSHDGFNFRCRNNRAYHCGYHRDASGRLLEIFLTTSKVGSEAQEHAETAAILASLLLQHGVPVEEIVHSIKGSPVALALEMAVAP